MPLLQRCRQLSFARLFALCVLMLGVVAQPALAAVGEVHELSHGGNLHDVDAHAEGPDDDAGGDPDADAGLSHALMHAGHCCGHLVAIPMTLDWAPIALPEQAPVSFSVAAASRRVDNPLRPPIVA